MAEIIGTSSNDTLPGTEGNDIIHGLAGDDSLSGFGGDDLLYGWDNNDTLYGGDGADFLIGQDGADSMDGGAGDDYLDGGTENDYLSGGEGADTLWGGEGNDTLEGGAGSNILYGGQGDDLYYPNNLAESIYEWADEGHDTIVIGIDGFKVDLTNIEAIQYLDGILPLVYWVDALVAGSYWVTPGTGTTLSYHFLTSSDDPTFVALSPAEKASVAQALALWAEVANLSFIATDNPAAANINFGFYALPEGVGGDASYPHPGGSRVRMDLEGIGQLATVGWFALLLHEIGHALGLKHPGDYDLSGGGAFPPYLPDDEDMRENSQMSYNWPDWGDPDYDHYLLTLRPFDIAAAQWLYGVNPGLNPDNDVYNYLDLAWPDTLIDDGDGIDLLDASDVSPVIGDGPDMTIDLRPGGRIYAGVHQALITASGQVSINYGTVIENALGSVGDDLITGNMANNNLDGGAGNDTIMGGEGADTIKGGTGNDSIDGGTGIDTVQFAGARNLYLLTLTAGGFLVSSADEGIDTVEEVEFFAFADQTINSDFTAPAIAVSSSELFLVLGETATISFLLSEASINFVLDDVAVSGGTLSNFSGSGVNYTAIFTPTTNSTANGVVHVASNRFTDAAGNANADGEDANNTITIIVDTLPQLTVIDGTSGDDTLIGGAADEIINGLDGDDLMVGGIGNDQLYGGKGADFLEGGPGDDMMDGSDDFDIASYFNATAGVTVDLSVAQLQDTSADGSDILREIEGLWGSSHNDYLSGNSAANVLLGFDGNDTLKGGSGQDSLQGGDGEDLLQGGAGNDFMNGGAGIDTSIYADAAAHFRLYWSDSEWLLSDNHGTEGEDILTGIEQLQFTDKTVDLSSKEHASYANIPDELWQFFIVAFSGAPGVFYMDQLLKNYNNGMSVQSFINIFVTKAQYRELYPTDLTREEFATRLVNNVVQDSALQQYKDLAVQDILNQFASGKTMGQVIYTSIGKMAKLGEASLIWGNTARLFNNQVKVAKFFTETMSQATTDTETLRAIVANVEHNTDVSTDAAIIELIGVALLNGDLG